MTFLHFKKTPEDKMLAPPTIFPYLHSFILISVLIYKTVLGHGCKHISTYANEPICVHTLSQPHTYIHLHSLITHTNFRTPSHSHTSLLNLIHTLLYTLIYSNFHFQTLSRSLTHIHFYPTYSHSSPHTHSHYNPSTPSHSLLRLPKSRIAPPG